MIKSLESFLSEMLASAPWQPNPQAVCSNIVARIRESGKGACSYGCQSQTQVWHTTRCSDRRVSESLEHQKASRTLKRAEGNQIGSFVADQKGNGRLPVRNLGDEDSRSASTLPVISQPSTHSFPSEPEFQIIACRKLGVSKALLQLLSYSFPSAEEGPLCHR